MLKPKSQLANANPNASQQSYDEVPYDSHCFHQTHPLLLQGIAKFYGLNTPPVETARILEIGCAMGGNIIPLAVAYPKSQCVGIDYSQSQIETGRKDVKTLGIHNMKLKHMSVMDVTKEFGEFDYIIAHGVLSWVPPEVQEKVLEVCKTNLSENGLAYISYNTLPGWHSFRGIRDMMGYYTAQTTNPKTRIQQARAVLSTLTENAVKTNNPQARMLQQEAARLATLPDYYIMHEYLEEDNHAFYFHEFMAGVQANKLQYLNDVCIENSYLISIPPEMAQLRNDRVSAEQYGDFMSERRFRRSILCHEVKKLNLNVTIDAIRDGCFVSNFSYPAGFENHNINSGINVSFPSANNLTLNTSEPLELAIQQVFMEVRKEAITAAQMMKRLEAKLSKENYAGEQGKALEDKVLGIVMRSIMYGGVQFFSAPMPCVYVVSEKPAVSELVRYQAKQRDLVSNLRHESVQLAPFERLLVQELDGTRDIPALVNIMARHFEAKTLSMGDMGRVIDNVAEIKQRLASIIEEKLQACCVMGLLVK